MCKLAKRGAHVKVVFIDRFVLQCKQPVSNLVPMVRTEVEETLTKLQCFESEILDLPCLHMHCDKESVNKLYRKIDYYAPDLIFIPTLHERHPDNVMTGLLAAHTLKEYNGFTPQCTPMKCGAVSLPNLVVDITNVMDEKIAAMKALQTENELKDNEQRLREANTFRLTTSRRNATVNRS